MLSIIAGVVCGCKTFFIAFCGFLPDSGGWAGLRRLDLVVGLGYFRFDDALSRAVSNRGTTPVSIYYICCQSATHIWVIDPNMNHFSTEKQAFWLIYESGSLCLIHIWVALGEHI